MIPYYHFGKLFTVPGLNRDVHVFGLLVVTAIIVGVNIAYWKAKQIGIDREKLSSMITFTLVVGFISAHLFDHLFYRFPEVVKNPLSLLNFWSGISSYGGFFGAFLAIVYYCRRHKLDFLKYSEPLAFGIPFAWIFGRMGCAAVHDHIGAKTTFFLGINFPPDPNIPNLAGVRHDLGFEEMIFTIFLSILFFVLRNKKEPHGFYLMLLCLLYAPIRYLFDSLRATDLFTVGNVAMNDTRYLGLTPGQYSSVAIFFAGLYLWNRLYKKGNSETQTPGLSEG